MMNMNLLSVVTPPSIYHQPTQVRVEHSLRDNLPITDACLCAIATLSLPFDGSFSKLQLVWDSNPAAKKSWNGWKMWSLGAQKTIKRKQCVSGKRGNVFVIASSAVSIHGITAVSTPSLFAVLVSSPPDLSAAFSETLEGHLTTWP